jgi:hypothetical protein
MTRLKQSICCCTPSVCGCVTVPNILTVTVSGIELPQCLDRPAGGSLNMAASDSWRGGGTYEVPRVSSSESTCIWRKIIGTATLRVFGGSDNCTGTFGGQLVNNVWLNIVRSNAHAGTPPAIGGHIPHFTTDPAPTNAQWQVSIALLELGFNNLYAFGACYNTAQAIYSTSPGHAVQTGSCCNDVNIINGFGGAAADCVSGSDADTTVHHDYNWGSLGEITISPDC